MLKSLELKNYGCHDYISWNNLGKINLIIGENGSGKSFILKAMYSALRTIEEYKKGDDNRSDREILSDKLYWTFQSEKIGDLVKKNTSESLYFKIIKDDESSFSYRLDKNAVKKVASLINDISNSEMHSSIFIPAKEVLSLFHIILKSREQDRVFGFDDTYLDLVKALQVAGQKGKNYGAFADSKKHLKKMLKGKAEYDINANKWSFKNSVNQKFAIGLMSEGVKKLSILDTLLSNRYLNNKSVVFIDEIESGLHPKAIADLMDIIFSLAQCGIQFVIASHSYFVIKKLYLLSLQNDNYSIPVLSLSDKEPSYGNMANGMPDNSIIDESIRLYEEEVEEVLS